MALHWLNDPRSTIVFLLGAAGGGKTTLAVAAAVEGLEQGLYDSILLTRVNVEAGDRVGFLKGDAEQKNEPWIATMINEFHKWIGEGNTQRLLKSKQVKH